MKLLSKTIPQTCEIALIGDTHEGNVMTHHHGIQRAIEWVKAKRNRYFVHMGDEIEAVASDDKRYQHDPKMSNPIPLQQANAVVEQFKPIASRCIVWLYGNHPEKLHRFGNLTRDVVCKNLGVPYGTWTSKVRLVTKDGKQVLKMFLCHGVRGAMSSNAKDEEQRRANMMANLKRKLVCKASDCMVMGMGHSHRLIVVPPSKKLILSDDGSEIQQGYLTQGDGAASYIEPDRRWYVNTGSYVKTYELDTDGYAERAGYDPVELGHVIVSIRGGKLADVQAVYA